MATGPGFTDPQGVYMIGETDERPLGSDLLNLPGKSVSTQLGLVRAELRALRDTTTPQTYTPTIGAGSGISLGSDMLVTKVGRVVHVQLHLTKASAIVASQGLIWLPAPYGAKQQRPLVDWYGSGTPGHLLLAGTGQLVTDTTVALAGATILIGSFTYVSAA